MVAQSKIINSLITISLIGLLIYGAGEETGIRSGRRHGTFRVKPVERNKLVASPNGSISDHAANASNRMVLVSRGKRREVKSIKLRGFLESKGSPMASTTEELVEIANEYNIAPELLIGIAGVESSYGRRCYGHNPFGYLKAGAGTGLRTYSSWPKGYNAICKFIVSHWGNKRYTNSSQLPGYCVPSGEWMKKVERMKP